MTEMETRRGGMRSQGGLWVLVTGGDVQEAVRGSTVTERREAGGPRNDGGRDDPAHEAHLEIGSTKDTTGPPTAGRRGRRVGDSAVGQGRDTGAGTDTFNMHMHAEWFTN